MRQANNAKGEVIMKRMYFIAPVAILALLLMYNVSQNKLDYFQIPLYTILNLMVAIIFAFYLTQCRTDERKQKESAEHLIGKILLDLTDVYMYNIGSEKDVQCIRIAQRSIHNRIEGLKAMSNKLGVEEEVCYIDDQFRQYWDFISDHINDIDYLSKSQSQLLNYVANVQNKLEEAIRKLYF